MVSTIGTQPTTERLTLTLEEIAQMMGVSIETLRRHRRHLPPAIRIGRQFRFNRDEIMAFLRQGGLAPVTPAQN